jgi:hypothetical protein
MPWPICLSSRISKLKRKSGENRAGKNRQRSILWCFGNPAITGRNYEVESVYLNIEKETDNIPVLHYVGLAFLPHLAGFLGAPKGSGERHLIGIYVHNSLIQLRGPRVDSASVLLPSEI